MRVKRQRYYRNVPEKPDVWACTICHEVKPFNALYFPKHKGYSHGMRYWCRKCERKRKALHKATGCTKTHKGKVTILTYPRVMTTACISSPYNKKVFTHMHKYITTHQLTCGCRKEVNWCAKHDCEAPEGDCERCLDIAEKELIRYTNSMAAEREADMIAQEKSAYDARLARVRNRNFNPLPNLHCRKPKPAWPLPAHGTIKDPADPIFLEAL